MPNSYQRTSFANEFVTHLGDANSLCSMGHRLLGPFPKVVAEKNHLVVAIDHFTRGVEMKALTSITAWKVKSFFFFEDIIYRFGIPKILISKNDK